MKQIIQCEFLNINWTHTKNCYTCVLDEIDFRDGASFVLRGRHLDGRKNRDVRGIQFERCQFSRFPQGLSEIFPNLIYVEISNCERFTYIERDDLKEYTKLKELSLQDNKLFLLPGDLFADMEQLEVLDIKNRGAVIIEPTLLNNLRNLKHVDLECSVFIKFYSVLEPEYSYATLKEIKQALLDNYQPSHFLKKRKNDMEMSAAWKMAVTNNELNDFVVAIGEEEFKVHKFVLASRSPALARMISADRYAERIDLVDVQLDTFKEILHFMYFNEYPKKKDTDFMQLLSSSEKLEITSLAKFAAENLKGCVNANNALELLKMSNQYGHDELRMKSYKELKKLINIENAGDLSTQPEKLVELLEFNKKKEKILAELDVEYNSILKKVKK
jgi:Leucine-rich repeat (LRR) protein